MYAEEAPGDLPGQAPAQRSGKGGRRPAAHAPVKGGNRTQLNLTGLSRKLAKSTRTVKKEQSPEKSPATFVEDSSDEAEPAPTEAGEVDGVQALESPREAELIGETFPPSDDTPVSDKSIECVLTKVKSYVLFICSSLPHPFERHPQVLVQAFRTVDPNLAAASSSGYASLGEHTGISEEANVAPEEHEFASMFGMGAETSSENSQKLTESQLLSDVVAPLNEWTVPNSSRRACAPGTPASSTPSLLSECTPRGPVKHRATSPDASWAPGGQSVASPSPSQPNPHGRKNTVQRSASALPSGGSVLKTEKPYKA